MARSVSTHRNAASVAYLQHGDDEDFDCFIDDVRHVVKERYPSFDDCDRWQDREDHVVLENSRAEVSISEYNGLVAVCIAPRDVENPLDCGWTDRVATNFRKCVEKAYGGSALISNGYASNGEQFFTLKNEPGSCVTSKEGRLW